MASSTRYPSIPQPTRHGGSLPTGPEHQPVPYRLTPPWGEQPIYDEHVDAPAPPILAVDHRLEDEQLHAWQNVAHGNGAFALDWENDHQYGYPPPGAPNDQPWDGGHFAHTPWDPSREQGWGMDPAFRWPRYPHMENHFSRYNQNGQWRREGNHPTFKASPMWWSRMQQRRDLIAAGRRSAGPHQIVTRDAPTVPHTQNVQAVSQFYAPDPIGIEGILPS